MAKAKMRRAVKRRNFRKSIPTNGMNDPDSFERPEGHPLAYPKVMTYTIEETGTVHSYLGPDKRPIIVADEKEHNAFLEHLRKSPKKVKGVTENLEEGVEAKEESEDEEIEKQKEEVEETKKKSKKKKGK